MVLLLVVNTIFEVVTYCWVFLWVAILQDTQQPGEDSLPFGRMFSCFMGAMSLGSLVYNLALRHFGPSNRGGVAPAASDAEPVADENAPLLAASGSSLPGPASASPSISFHATLAVVLLLLAGSAHISAYLSNSTRGKFLAFLAYESSLGLYYPVVANLRAAMFPDECRATLTALFRLPFNVLVTIALVSGLEERREAFLVASGVALVGAAGVAAVIGWRSARGC